MLIEDMRECEGCGAAPNLARIIKEQNGNVRAALSILDSKLDALKGTA